jgi:hypothetical protein
MDEQRELTIRLAELLFYLLKWEHTALLNRRDHYSWRQGIDVLRKTIADRIQRLPSPSRDSIVTTSFTDAWYDAVVEASKDEILRGLGSEFKTQIPDRCPWLLEQVLDEDFLPGDCDWDAAFESLKRQLAAIKQERANQRPWAFSNFLILKMFAPLLIGTAMAHGLGLPIQEAWFVGMGEMIAIVAFVVRDMRIAMLSVLPLVTGYMLSETQALDVAQVGVNLLVTAVVLLTVIAVYALARLADEKGRHCAPIDD